MISVILCTYNRSQSLKQTLRSLQDMSVPRELAWELIIVDNNSRDDTKAVVQSFAESSGLTVRYVFEANQGLAHARNAGIREARGEILCFIDDDIAVHPDWVAQISHVFAQFDCIGVGGKIVPVWSCARPSWLQEEGPYRLMKVIVSFDLGEETRVIKSRFFGANMAFRRTAFERHGGFRTDLGRIGNTLMSGEDSEFCERLLRAGEKLVYGAKAIVYHPVEEQRITKGYFKSWYFNYGKLLVKRAAERGEKGRAGPFLILTNLLKRLVKWMFSLKPSQRFYYKLHFYLEAGQLVEICKGAGK